MCAGGVCQTQDVMHTEQGVHQLSHIPCPDLRVEQVGGASRTQFRVPASPHPPKAGLTHNSILRNGEVYWEPSKGEFSYQVK